MWRKVSVAVPVLVRVPQRNRTSRIYKDIDRRRHYRNWLMQLWRPRSPTVWNPRTRKAGGIIQSESVGLRTRGVSDVTPSLRPKA